MFDLAQQRFVFDGLNFNAKGSAAGVEGGADGGHVQSIAAIGTTHLDDGRTDTAHDYDLQVIGKFGGTLKVDSDDGDYIYAPPAADDNHSHVTESFTIMVTDGDGDTVSTQLDMLIDDPDHPHSC